MDSNLDYTYYDSKFIQNSVQIQYLLHCSIYRYKDALSLTFSNVQQLHLLKLVLSSKVSVVMVEIEWTENQGIDLLGECFQASSVVMRHP